MEPEAFTLVSTIFADMRFQQTTLNCNGRLLDLSRPVVMGILNVTPDSFFDGGAYKSPDVQLRRVEAMLNDGATIIDVGGMSSRPGAPIIEVKEELRRVVPAVTCIVKRFPEAILSVDTIQSKVAREAINAGAAIINDISAGSLDPLMYQAIAELGVPYILMHMQGQPLQMQENPHYENVALEVLDFFIGEIGKLRALKVKDIIVDPGFGFGKTVAHNYELLNNMHTFKMLEVPILAGISRKSMICKVLKVNPSNALNGTTALHMIALQQGARILRVHDVKEARQCIQLFEQLNDH